MEDIVFEKSQQKATSGHIGVLGVWGFPGGWEPLGRAG